MLYGEDDNTNNIFDNENILNNNNIKNNSFKDQKYMINDINSDYKKIDVEPFNIWARNEIGKVVKVEDFGCFVFELFDEPEDSAPSPVTGTRSSKADSSLSPLRKWLIVSLQLLVQRPQVVSVVSNCRFSISSKESMVVFCLPS